MTLVATPSLEQMAAWQLAADALSLLARAFSSTRSTTCETCAYAPDVVRYFLMTWPELESAVEGVSASSAGNSRGGSRDRGKLIAIKADLELATDRSFTNSRYLMWQSVLTIYERQGRQSYLWARRRELSRWEHGDTHRRKPEPPLAEAEGFCFELIARRLGWIPHECSVAA